MSDSNDGFKTFISFLAGAAVGAIMGVLFAPKPGKELREDLKDFSEKIADDAKAEYVKLSMKTKDTGGRTKRFVEEARNKIRKDSQEPESGA